MTILDLRAEASREKPALGAPMPALAGPAIATWRTRMVNEWASSAVFEALGAQFDATDLDGTLGDTCREFATEERRHGLLCGAVVEALGGEATARIGERPSFPLHEEAPPRAALLRNVVSVCCMSETVAVALIGAERFEMPKGPLRDLLTRIWADEVGHSRFGWKLLESVGPSLTRAERDAVTAYLPTAFSHLVAYELDHLPARRAPEGGAALGLCSGIDARELLSETIRDVIRPGLARWFG